MRHQKNIAHLFKRTAGDDVKSTEHFHASNTCIDCGICARLCPANAIQMHNGRPLWIKSQCFACLGCLRGCPTEAITYGIAKQKRK